MTDNEIISIDEAIRHCYETYFERDDLYRKEHKQLAKWLEELKESHNTINHQEAENERLLQKLQRAKSEAIKEFADRLKSISIGLEIGDDKKIKMMVVSTTAIDNIAKEMTEVKENEKQ